MYILVHMFGWRTHERPQSAITFTTRSHVAGLCDLRAGVSGGGERAPRLLLLHHSASARRIVLHARSELIPAPLSAFGGLGGLTCKQPASGDAVPTEALPVTGIRDCSHADASCKLRFISTFHVWQTPTMTRARIVIAPLDWDCIFGDAVEGHGKHGKCNMPDDWRLHDKCGPFKRYGKYREVGICHMQDTVASRMWFKNTLRMGSWHPDQSAGVP